MKRSVYYLPAFNLPVILAAVMMLCSAGLRIAWWCSGDLSAYLAWTQGALPVTACLIAIPIIFRDGKTRLFRTAVPVWLGCIFFALKALTFPSLLHTILCLCLYALVAALYTATVTGHVPTQRLLLPLFGLPLLYHIFVEDMGRDWTTRELTAELSVLLIMAGLFCLSLAMKKKEVKEGEYILRFGDRNDGRRLRSLSPIFAVSPYLMKTRNTSSNFLEDSVEVTEMERYITEKRREGLKNFGTLHVLLAVYVRACAKYPGLNRFIAGQKIFTRDNEIEVNMTVKKEMRNDSPDTVIKVTFEPSLTAAQVYERFNERVREVKDAPVDTSFDKLAGVFNMIPGLLLKGFVFLLQAMDYFGLLPRFLTKLSPFHGSLYVTSMASLGIPPIYHHLYDFGNVPVFCAMGKKRRVLEPKRDGTVELKKYIDFTYVTDERIVDGFYYASALRYIHNLLSDPWQLDEPPAEINRDQA